MPDSAKLTLFLVASAVLIATPGPNVLYILARSIAQGRLAGIVSVAGVGIGNLVHAIAAALGLSVILASSAVAFSALKYAGAVYLVYLGVKRILTPPADYTAASFQPESRRRIFRQGILVGVLNPKVALFFLSFLPQFADPHLGSVPTQLLMYGIAFVVLATLGDSIWALLSGTFGGWLKRNPTFLRNERYVSGTVYCGLGVVAALSHPVKQP